MKSIMLLFTRKISLIKDLLLLFVLAVYGTGWISKLTNTSPDINGTDKKLLTVRDSSKSVGIGNMPSIIEDKQQSQVKLSVTNEKGLDFFPIRVYGISSGAIILPNGSVEIKYDWLGSEYFHGCRYSNCKCTKRHDEASVVLVDMRGFDRGEGQPPLPRMSGQLWIAWGSHPPPYVRTRFWKKLENQFHLTASYQLNSDIHVPFGSYVERSSLIEEPVMHATEADIKNKKKLVAWIADDCGGQSGRRKYVKELQKYVQVDVYGKCGNLSCSKDSRHGNFPPSCRQILYQYKFYLAFEYLICMDYLTYEVWDNIAIVVPIVLGASDYNRQLPPHSFIDVRDFTSAKKLAHYLLHLNNNPEEYHKYYNWIKKYDARSSRFSHSWRCKLCEYLNTHNFTEKQLQEPKVNFQSLTDAAYACQAPDTFYKNILYE